MTMLVSATSKFYAPKNFAKLSLNCDIFQIQVTVILQISTCQTYKMQFYVTTLLVQSLRLILASFSVMFDDTDRCERNVR